MANRYDTSIVILNLHLPTEEADELLSFCQTITWRKTEHFTRYQDHRTYNLKMAFDKLFDALNKSNIK